MIDSHSSIDDGNPDAVGPQCWWYRGLHGVKVPLPELDSRAQIAARAAWIDSITGPDNLFCGNPDGLVVDRLGGRGGSRRSRGRSCCCG